MTDLSQLLEKVRTATAGSRELDAEIAETVGIVPDGALRMHRLPDPAKWATGAYDAWTAPHLTTSLDAIVALIERELPGWVVADLCQNSRHAGDPWGCTLAVYFGSTPSKNKSASSGYDFPSAPLALCAAFLSALISKEKADG